MENKNFMTKVLCEEEITMDDIRRVEKYRDELIVLLNQTVKPASENWFYFNKRTGNLVSEIQLIHVWIKQQLISSPYPLK